MSFCVLSLVVRDLPGPIFESYFESNFDPHFYEAISRSISRNDAPSRPFSGVFELFWAPWGLLGALLDPLGSFGPSCGTFGAPLGASFFDLFRVPVLDPPFLGTAWPIMRQTLRIQWFRRCPRVRGSTGPQTGPEPVFMYSGIDMISTPIYLSLSLSLYIY